MNNSHPTLEALSETRKEGGKSELQQQYRRSLHRATGERNNTNNMEISAALMREIGGAPAVQPAALSALDKSVDIYFNNSAAKRRSKRKREHRRHRERSPSDSSDEAPQHHLSRHRKRAAIGNSLLSGPASRPEGGQDENHQGGLPVDAGSAVVAAAAVARRPSRHEGRSQKRRRHHGAGGGGEKVHKIGPSAQSDSSAADLPTSSCSSGTSESSEDDVLRCEDSIDEMEKPRIYEWAGLLKKRPTNDVDRQEIKNWLLEVLVVSNSKKNEPLKVVTSGSSTNFNWESSTGSDLDRGDDGQSNSSSSGGSQETESNDDDDPKE